MSAAHMIGRLTERAQFARIDNATLQDASLSWAARGMLAYFLSLPPDWTVHVADLIKRSPGGRRVVTGILRELAEAGYVKMRETRTDKMGRALPLSAGDGKFAPAIQCVHERPVTTCEHDRPVRETCTGNDQDEASPVRETYTGEEIAAEQGKRDKPAGHDQCAKRHMAKRAPTNETQTNEEERTKQTAAASKASGRSATGGTSVPERSSNVGTRPPKGVKNVACRIAGRRKLESRGDEGTDKLAFTIGRDDFGTEIDGLIREHPDWSGEQVGSAVVIQEPPSQRSRHDGPVTHSRKQIAMGDVAAYRDTGQDDLADELQAQIHAGEFDD